ncbi:hypothetical protein [Spirulina sp. 06S082]|uniref:hypothetical protein n=1 Tax=Spirulina sp. 06S082 TaxID=3110248 RepID=UPI002B1FE96B|nr:hypothetical protein [Spirulina sp. 06S082]MEA5468250.1 hypothetical protein [Spirulina sp. 06S082]
MSIRNNLLDALANWRKTIEIRDNITEDDREVIMNLSAVYLRQREEWKQEGLQEGRRIMIENLLKVRFGTISEALEDIIDRLLRLEEEEMVRSLLNLSHEELLSRFGEEEE